MSGHKTVVVAVEDRRFYHHFGIDPIGMLRAAWVNKALILNIPARSYLSQVWN